MLNAGSADTASPSVAAISTAEYVPISVAAGVPESLPVAASNAAQAGLFAMVNVTVSLSASVAVGANAYACPVVAAIGAVPAICGAELPEAGGGAGVGEG